MKTLVVLAAVLGAGLFATTSQAAMMPAPVKATSGIEMAGIVCGPGFHLWRGVCVRNVVRRGCAIGMRLGPAGVCIR